MSSNGTTPSIHSSSAHKASASTLSIGTQPLRLSTAFKARLVIILPIQASTWRGSRNAPSDVKTTMKPSCSTSRACASSPTIRRHTLNILPEYVRYSAAHAPRSPSLHLLISSSVVINITTSPAAACYFMSKKNADYCIRRYGLLQNQAPETSCDMLFNDKCGIKLHRCQDKSRTSKFQKAVFHRVKDGILACNLRPFGIQKTAFCTARIRHPDRHIALKYNKLTVARHKVCIFATLYKVFIAEQTIITHISK